MLVYFSSLFGGCLDYRLALMSLALALGAAHYDALLKRCLEVTELCLGCLVDSIFCSPGLVEVAIELKRKEHFSVTLASVVEGISLTLGVQGL